MAAWLEDAANPERPAIRVIPTADGGLDAALAEAVTAGADLILGPLEREAVLALLDGRELPLPVLALNIVPVEERPPLGDPGNRLLQFGLLPEHEAAAAAEYAARQGWHAPALILPEGAWGERLRAAFERQHASLSGGPVTVHRYREGGDYQGLVRALLAGGEEAAAPQPAAAPTAAATDPSVRPGWPGFVFVAGRSADVRQLVPYLRYYGAGALPRATTSLTWTGQVAPDQDLDLDGTLITEVPLLLGAASVGTVPFEQARAAWPRRGAQAWRLFAFGLDAYRLALNYGDLRLGRIGGLDGATGQITLEEGGTVQNHPGWAVFRGGRPRPLDAGVAP
jgi:outer membrane PBP1 activator LpoA protein